MVMLAILLERGMFYEQLMYDIIIDRTTFYEIFMFKEGRGLWILCEMRRWSKVGHETQMVYNLILTAHIQVLITYQMICYILDDMMLIRS